MVIRESFSFQMDRFSFSFRADGTLGRVADVHDTAAARLRDADQRYTTNRRAIVAALAEAGGPVTLPELLAADRSLPQSSAYRNLAILEEAGVVRRVVGSGEFARYELAEDLTEHHHHLICTNCGKVVDYTMPDQLERAVRKATEAVAADNGYEISGHQLDLFGLCRDCK